MKFGQLIEHNVKNIFKNHAENKVAELVPYPFFFFKKKKKALYEVKASALHLSINFDNPALGHTVKTNCIKLSTVDPELCSILIF